MHIKISLRSRCRNRVRFLKNYAKEVSIAQLHMRAPSTRIGREEHLIKWIPPGEGWTKLNTDGASHGNLGLATAGEVLRNGDGNWCGDLTLNIGICSASLMELWEGAFTTDYT